MSLMVSDRTKGMPRKLSVRYMPTPANELIIRKIGPLLDDCECEALAQGDDERRSQLLEMTSLHDTVLIWGDGYNHHDSFFFTSGSAISLKVNLDPHPDEHQDEDDGGAMDFSTLRPKLELIKYLTYGNHMTYTERTGVDIFTSGSHLRGSGFMRALLREVSGSSMRSLLRRAAKLIMDSDGDVALTIDNDIVRGFPVRPEFSHKRFSVSAMRVLEVLEDIPFMRKVCMLDFGGLVHEIPDFELWEDVPLDKPPSARAVAEFMRLGKEKDAEHTGPQKEMVDAVGSYVAMYYARIINAYSWTHISPL